MKRAFDLRPVADGDTDALLAVYADSRASELSAVPWPEVQKQSFVRFQYAAQVAHYRREYPDALHQAIVCDDRVVGRLYVDRRAAEIRILDVALLEDYRGIGIGGAVVRALQTEARSFRSTVSVHVDAVEPSVSVFEHLGFVCAEDNGVTRLMVWTPSENGPG